MRSLRIATLLALCATALPLAAQQGARGVTYRDSAVVDVQNQRAVPVTIFLRTGRFDRRIAIVPAHTTRMVLLPAVVLEGRENVALVVHPEGEPDLGTRMFIVRSGDRLSLEIPALGKLPPTPGDTMSAPLTPEELATATLTVDNPHDRPVTVYVERGLYDVRLGQVPARERATLPLPKSVVGKDRALRIFVHPEGGQDLSSSLLRVKKGEHLGLKVPKF